MRDLSLLERVQQAQAFLPDLDPEQLQENAAPQYHTDVVVVFCDIRSFTDVAQKLTRAPSALVDLLERFMATVETTAESCHCTVDKFIGDGAMLLSLPSAMNDHSPIRKAAINAIEFGLRLDEAIPNMVANWFEANVGSVVVVPTIMVGVGVHVGPATVGLIKGERRAQFTALGDTVNIAQRFETVAGKAFGDYRCAPVVISAPVAELCKEHYDLENHRVPMPKSTEVLNIFSVRARKSERGD
jgi:adenylate cyclase